MSIIVAVCCITKFTSYSTLHYFACSFFSVDTPFVAKTKKNIPPRYTNRRKNYDIREDVALLHLASLPVPLFFPVFLHFLLKRATLIKDSLTSHTHGTHKIGASEKERKKNQIFPHPKKIPEPPQHNIKHLHTAMSFRREQDIDYLVKRKDPSSTMKNILVTGGCGFIASNFINLFMRNNTDVNIFNVDKLDYCSNEKSVEADLQASGRYTFIRGDICNLDHMMYIFKTSEIDTVVHFAAESHVDNSFGNSLTFTRNNVQGTHTLLEVSRVYGKIQKFIHVSTDEVYGEVSQSQSENGFLNPTNPYAATKAAAEFIVKSYLISFGLPCIITRGNNVYGPYQYPEKLIPRFTMLLHNNRKLTIQGTGANTRTFIHAHDVARAFETIVKEGVIGEIYNIGSLEEHSVLTIAERIVKEFHGEEADVNDYVEYVKDRAFNDTRYDIKTDKLIALGWKEQIDFKTGLADTIKWYRKALSEGFWADIKMHIDSEKVAYPKSAKH